VSPKKQTNLKQIGKGRSNNSPTVRDVGDAVFVVLGHLPGCVVETVRLADALDPVEVDGTSQPSFVLPSECQEVIKVIQLLLQDDEEQATIPVNGKTTGLWKFGETRDHDSTNLLWLWLLLLLLLLLLLRLGS
jgi:hypothetical protein